MKTENIALDSAAILRMDSLASVVVGVREHWRCA